MLAGMLTTLCWTPQLIRTWRTRSSRDISWTYLAALSIGVGMWFAYGLVEHDLALAISNAATGAALLTLVCFKVRFDHNLRHQDVTATVRPPT